MIVLDKGIAQLEKQGTAGKIREPLLQDSRTAIATETSIQAALWWTGFVLL